MLLVGGGLDRVWGLDYGVTAVRTRRLEHGEKDTEALVFDGAGHFIDFAVPYLPEATEFAVDGVTLVSGGTRLARRYTGRPLMAVPKRKTSKSRRDKRRAQHAIAAPRVSTCENCGSPKQSHRACPTCKTYRGREVRPLRTPAP